MEVKMANLKTLVMLLGFCLLGATSSQAATYYVRTDGGSATQCTGLVDAPYPGTGTGKPCAFSHPFWAIAPIGNNPTKMVGGDTLVIDGAQGSQYMIGYGAPNTADTSKCHSTYPWDCYMRAIPSGPSPTQPTRILGKGWDTGCSAPPQLWGNERVKQVFNLAGSNNVEIQCLEVTDHSDCQDMGPKACNRSSFPYGPYSNVALFASDSSNVFIKNVNIHGMAYKGIYAGRLKDWTLEDSQIVANSFVGWDGDIGANVSSNSGTMMFNRVKILYNGCGETLTDKKPFNCYSQDQGGYGDGLGTHFTAGNWIFNNSDISHNTSDGLDLLYHNGNGSITIKRSRFEGNAGNQVKTAANTVIENSIMVGNCAYFKGKPFTWNNATFNNCRAGGNTVAVSFKPGMVASIYNSTLTSNGDVLIQTAGASCVGTEKIISRNNIYLGGTEYLDGSDKSAIFYNAGATGNGDGACGLIKFDDDYSTIWQTKYIATDCSNKPHSVCQDPKFVEPLVTYYNGDNYNVNLQTVSPAVNKGTQLTGMSSLDYNEFNRDTVWDMGALEFGSVAGTPGTEPLPAPSPLPVCGNNVLEDAEQCDDGNLTNGDGCASTCTTEIAAPVCGNGKVEIGETCDDGNLNNGDGCNSFCVKEIVPVCGNAKLEGTEQCDDGNLNNGDGCNSFCVKEILPVCGNGKLEGAEQCDDGNLFSNDGCSSLCVKEFLPVCGNGKVETGEVCDDGNTVSNDGCSSTCRAEWCGNGIKEGPEQCDDGNWKNRDGCSALCKLEVSSCGNGRIDKGETCDDGNRLSNDGCSSTCKKEYCGNGILEGTEQCDDGNWKNGDGCSALCLKESLLCGNGRLDNGEICDDGNTRSGDGCSNICRKEWCGNGIKEGPEQCDDGNWINRDGCSALCKKE